jgi:hypothetical protein
MLPRSGQKNLDEIQRIRAAIEGNKPVITGAQQELIIKYADVLGEDGKAMIEVIEEEARKSDKLPADVFRLIESCLSSLRQKAKRQDLSDEVMKQREPERLLQVEAIREHATMLHANRLNGDRLGEESVKKAMVRLVNEYMVAVDKDRDDGLDPDTAQMWKEQVHEIAAKAKLDQPSEGAGGSKSGPVAHSGTADRLAPLRSIIEQATYTMQATMREITDPDETILCGFGKQLGNSKKEIMAVSKDLVVGQPAGVAMEVTRLAGEACNAIKASRESIRAPLRELGAASDPRSQRTHQGPATALGETSDGEHRPGVGGGVPTSGPSMVSEATSAHAGRHSVAPHGPPAKAQDKGRGWRTVGSHAGYDERPSKRQRMAHLQWEVCGIPSVPKGVMGIQADVSRTCAR